MRILLLLLCILFTGCSLAIDGTVATYDETYKRTGNQRDLWDCDRRLFDLSPGSPSAFAGKII